MTDKTILHDVGALPTGYDYDYCSISSLGDYEAEQLAESGFVEAWYWYAYGSYEGSGDLIGRDAEGKWGHIGLGHCSCYGPCDQIGKVDWSPSFAHLTKDYLLEGAQSYCAHLIAAIREAGH